MILVSVIIPTFNRSEMLVEAIDSVVAQDYPDKEIIIVDDGSTDETSQVVARYGNKVDYLQIEHGGVSHARNVGIARSRGDLVAFLDSDDLWLPGKVERQAEYFKENPDISICQTEEIWVRNGKRVNPRPVHKKHSGWIFEKCIPLCIVSPSAVMIRHRVFDDIGLFDEEMPVCEDFDLWLRAALKYQIITLPEPMIVKRGGHTDQLSKQWGLDIWRIHALKKVLQSDRLDDRLMGIVTDDIIRRSRIVADGARKRGNLEIADKFECLDI